MNAQLTRNILGDLILCPALLKNSKLTSSDFPTGRERETFQGIAEIWKQTGLPEIPLAALAEKISGEGPVAFVSSLIDGNIPKTPDAFAFLVANLRRRRLIDRAFNLVHDEAEHAVKAGEIDPDKVVELEKVFAEIKALDEKGFDPYSFMRTGTQLQALDIHVDWTVEKLIPEGAITLLHGPGGLGKTWLCLGLAKAISEGVPFLGLQTKKREVVYLDYENPLAVDHDRACALNVCAPHFWHLSDSTRPPKLDGPDWALLKSLHPGALLFIDTARGATDGDDIKSQDVALVMNRLKEIRELGHDIVLQAHTSKANKKISKGATTWEDLADHTLALYRVHPGTLEEIEEEGLDPNALLYLGSGAKTRYEPCRFYVSLDPTKGTFSRTADPSQENLDKVAEYLANDGLGKKQKDIIAWAKENLGGGKTENFVALLKRGERLGRWKVHRGLHGARIYEPSI